MMKDEQIAHLCHEVNRAYCDAIGDDTQEPWKSAPKWQRDSAIAGVQFHKDNPNAGPEGSHNSWCMKKLEEGWTYGETKNAKVKTHPCMVPFEQLSDAQRAKDFIFTAIVKTIASF